MAHASLSVENSTTVRPSTERTAAPLPFPLGFAIRHFPAWTAAPLGRLFLTPHGRHAPLDLSGARELLKLRVGRELVRVGLWGTGPIVLLVHGWAGGGAQFDALRQRLLADGFSVACFDAPAHGTSRARTTNLFEFVAVVGEVAERLPLHALVGHSLGAAAVAVWANAQSASGAPGLVLIAPMPSFDFAVDQFASTLGLPEEVKQRMARNVEARVDFRRADFDLPAMQPNARTLFVHDTKDRATPIEHSRTLTERWPFAELLETSGLGHTRPLSDPGVQERIARFIASLPEPRRSPLDRQLSALGQLSFE